MLYLGSDHAGYELKKIIMNFLADLGIEYEDLGNINYEKDDDYPHFARNVSIKVKETGKMGILFCGSGVGVCMVANKISRVRAVNAYCEEIARDSREHNHSNILCLGKKYVNDDLAKKIIKAWLAARPSKETRHKRRVSMF